MTEATNTKREAPIPPVEQLAGVVALCGSVAAACQAVQGHNADEVVFTIYAIVLLGVAVGLLRRGASWGPWVFAPIVGIVLASGSSTGSWLTAAFLACAALLVFHVMTRRVPKGQLRP